MAAPSPMPLASRVDAAGTRRGSARRRRPSGRGGRGAMSPSERIARSTRAATRPKSAWRFSGRSPKESTWTRLASQTAPGRLPPTGGCSVQLLVRPDGPRSSCRRRSRRAGRLPRRAAAAPGSARSLGLAWDEGLLVRHRHAAHSQLLSSCALWAVKRRPLPTETITWSKPAACRKTSRRAGSIGLYVSPSWNS